MRRIKMREETEEKRKWICDDRSGVVAVYWAEKKKRCLSGCDNWSIFVRTGKYDNKIGYWTLPKKYSYQARFLTYILNFLKCEYLLSDVRDE
jgi:hypothetical protein